MKRIAIFGLPGSGKSTFADKLGKKLNLPVHHLDRYFFVANWKERDRDEFLNWQQSRVNEEEWILEGNSIASLEMRFKRADTIIYFKLPRYVCFWRVFMRPFFHDASIIDIPDGCTKNVSFRLLKYLWQFDSEKKEKIQELRSKYPDVKFYTFTNREDIFKFLKCFLSVPLCLLLFL